jgi:7-carboxy-7-deazaguanine synthase
MIHDEIVELLETLSDNGYHTTVETNGTIHRDAPIDLASISPKLASSTPTPEKDPKGDGEWETEHEERRLDVDALAQLVEDYPFQLKFVITGKEDLSEIQALLDELRPKTGATIDNDDILLMPEGATRDRLNETREVTA